MSKDIKVVSFARSPAYVHHRAMMNRRDNNIVDALELLRRAVEESPDNREYRLDLAELYCEMGCHAQSNRLLLDMLAEGEGPSECYYGLALNQLGLNDVPGARQALRLYRSSDPEGAHLEEVRQLAAELDFYSEISHTARRLNRAARIANRACEAMKGDNPERACRLFEQSLSLASEQYDMRALYAMALLIRGDREAARREAERAAEGYPPSVRALCVCAQVMYLLDEVQEAWGLIARAAAEKPEGQELRLMVYAMGELRLHEQVAESARLALQESPFDRDLMHMRAIALYNSGVPQERLTRFWERILRIDPQDSVAQFYQETALAGRLGEYTLDYSYQVPREEFARRLSQLVGYLGEGFERVEALWNEDAGFRQLLGWAVRAEDSSLSRAAMVTLTAIDSEESRSLLRSLLFSGEVPLELKLHAALSLRLQGISMDRILPAGAGLTDGLLPDAEAMLSQLPVGERALVRYADEVLQREYDVEALSKLLLMWSAYRQSRGTKADPLRCIEGASAALAYNYLLLYGPKPEIGKLAKAFNCAPRQLLFYARRMAGCLERITK